MYPDSILKLDERQDIFDIWNNLTKTELMIYVALRELGDVTQAEIARYLDTTERKVRQAVKILKSAKVVTIVKSGRNNEYFFAPIQERKQEQDTEVKPEIPPINNNDNKSIDSKKISPNVFNDLEALGILDLPQKSRYARNITKGRTPRQWLMSYDRSGNIAARVTAWRKFADDGGLIDVDPICLWLNILKGDEPPEREPLPEIFNRAKELTVCQREWTGSETALTKIDSLSTDGDTQLSGDNRDLLDDCQDECSAIMSELKQVSVRKNLLQGAKIAITGDLLTLTTNGVNVNPMVIPELKRNLNMITENKFRVEVK